MLSKRSYERKEYKKYTKCPFEVAQEKIDAILDKVSSYTTIPELVIFNQDDNT